MYTRVMIVKLMLVYVYIFSECECAMLTLDQVMCPSYGKTVVAATVNQVEPSDADGNGMYIMDREVVFKDGPNELQEPSFRRFRMKFPSEGMPCGFTFSVDFNTQYIIAGDVGSDGILYSNMCQYMKLSEEVLKESRNGDLLYGITRPLCGRGDS